MKYHLDTIPVWDAYQRKDECPLCVLEYQAEKSYIDFFLSGSVMEPETRVEVNKVGFCPHHFHMLYKAQNRLGLALITHTHLKEAMQKLNKKASDLLKDAENTLSSSFSASLVKKAIRRDNKLESDLKELLHWVNKHNTDCMVCNRIDNSLKRYAYTILHLWNKDMEFKGTLLKSKGFCLPHLSIIMKVAEETLSTKTLARWISDILPIQLKSIETLEGELLWFTQKFDYRNQDKPWGNSKDALPRTLQKLTGRYMEEQQEEE